MLQQQRTVLIVDDSPEDRELYRRYLLRDPAYTYTIVEATLGQQGLELWQQQRPDVMLLDYRLPDLDGLEFLTQLCPLTPQPCFPIIVVTGQGNEAIAVQAIKAGAQDYLVKGQITPERLHLALNGAIETVQLRTQLQQRIEREKLVAQITQKIYQTRVLEEILQTTVTEVRQFLHTDRVFVYRLQPDFSGSVVVESVGDNWLPILDAQIEDPYFMTTRGADYWQGRIQAVADINAAGLTECNVDLLTRFQVRANLVVPILHGKELWGLLVANHCAAPRQWQPLEIDLLKELVIQVGIALQQREFYQQSQTELTDRKQAEQGLQQSEERYRALFESINEGFCIIEMLFDQHHVPCDYRFLEINPVFEQQTGLQQATGKTARQLLPDLEPHWFEIYGKVALTGEPVRFENGSDVMNRWFEVSAFRIGQPDRYKVAILFKDISDRKRAEQDRAQLLAQEQSARAEAERANRIKDEFLAVLSHELRSPLNPILGWTKLLQTHKFDQTKTAEALATIERNAKLQTQLIDDLLDIAKILRGKLSINATPVNLAVVIEAAIDTVRTAAVAKSIRVHPVLPNIGQVSGDATRLQQIVWNLLSNAIKFTPKGGRIEIQLSRVSDQAQIVVSDTGKGIDPDFLPHIFESFRQEDFSITRKYGGLGLGLAIVRQLVEALGGTIEAASPGEGLGATFTVQLPLLTMEPGNAQIEQGSEPEYDLTGIRVLTVDDDPDARELLTVLLTQYGAAVLSVTSAAEVLATLNSFQPDVLVSDIGMPEVDGYTLIQQIRTLPAEKGGQVPAIALTAYAREDDQQRTLISGYQRHLTKPLELEQLVQAVAELGQSKPI